MIDSSPMYRIVPSPTIGYGLVSSDIRSGSSRRKRSGYRTPAKAPPR